MDIKKTIENLEKNNMKVYHISSEDELLPLLDELIPEGVSVSAGGSVTLHKTGVFDYLRNRNVDFLDRFNPSLSKDELTELYRKAFFTDVFVTSSNAITEDGELYNVDGRGNRVAALIYGPDSVIVVAGINKIVKNIDEAVERVKRIAAPKNCSRLSVDSYCSKAGECVKAEGKIGSGCKSGICSSFVVSGYQMIKDRVKVVLIDKELGY